MTTTRPGGASGHVLSRRSMAVVVAVPVASLAVGQVALSLVGRLHGQTHREEPVCRVAQEVPVDLVASLAQACQAAQVVHQDPVCPMAECPCLCPAVHSDSLPVLARLEDRVSVVRCPDLVVSSRECVQVGRCRGVPAGLVDREFLEAPMALV